MLCRSIARFIHQVASVHFDFHSWRTNSAALEQVHFAITRSFLIDGKGKTAIEEGLYSLATHLNIKQSCRDAIVWAFVNRQFGPTGI